jgi:hypothetical protein
MPEKNSNGRTRIGSPMTTWAWPPRPFPGTLRSGRRQSPNRLGLDQSWLSSFFPWNEDVYKNLKRFNNLHHFVCDADDAALLDRPMSRLALSQDLYNENWRIKKKFDKIVFIGRTDCLFDSYKERKESIEAIKTKIDIIIIESTFEYWEDYMEKLSQFRFVLCPVGNGNIITAKFYEALMVGGIPVQQIKDNTLDRLPIEKGLKGCIFFKNPQEMMMRMKTCKLKKSHNLIFMEDVLREALKDIL